MNVRAKKVSAYARLTDKGELRIDERLWSRAKGTLALILDRPVIEDRASIRGRVSRTIRDTARIDFRVSPCLIGLAGGKLFFERIPVSILRLDRHSPYQRDEIGYRFLKASPEDLDHKEDGALRAGVSLAPMLQIGLANEEFREIEGGNPLRIEIDLDQVHGMFIPRHVYPLSLCHLRVLVGSCDVVHETEGALDTPSASDLHSDGIVITRLSGRS